MKHITLLLLFTCFFISSQSCNSDSKSESQKTETIFSQKKANEYTVIDDGPVYSFTVVPDQYESCKAVFAQSENELATDQFIFATDLRKSCMIAIDGRLIQIELVAKRTANLSAQFYKYEGKGYTIDLEVRQTEEVGPKLKKVRGQLKIMGQAGFRDVFYIMGEVEC